MLFSIVIPVFNSEKYLRKCLESVLRQTFSEFEIIIIDDGSTDSSPIILDKFAEEDSRIQVYHMRNEGVTKARKIGVSLTKGDYIIFVDSDDTINCELLSNIERTLKKFPNIDMIRFRCRMINDRPEFDHELYNDYNSDYNVLYSGMEAIRRWNTPDKRYEIFWLYAIVPVIIANCQRIVMIEYIGYNYTCDNDYSITHSSGYQREKDRTLNFIGAYRYLISKMKVIENEENVDLKFFYEEWRRRLQKRYNILSEPLKTELISPFSDEFRHIDLMITTKTGKRYIVDCLADLVEMQVGLKTNKFASKEYYDKTYKETYKNISFLTDEELEEIDNKIGYKNENSYLDKKLDEIKKYFDNSNNGQAIDSEDKIIGDKVKYICEHLNNRNRINGIVDLVMYINTVISKVFSKEEKRKIQVLNFFVDEKDIINKELDLILDKKDKRNRGVAINTGNKYFIMGLNPLFKEYNTNEWNDIVNENKIFVRPKFNVILLNYLRENGADRNIIHNNEFLRLFSIFEKNLIKNGKKLRK